MSAGMPQILDGNAIKNVEREILGVSPDPLRPGDVQVPQFMQHRPPTCPKCSLLLENTNVNPVGDLLFVCQNDGYEAVWRRETNSWDQRVGVRDSAWKAPSSITLKKGQKRETIKAKQIQKLAAEAQQARERASAPKPKPKAASASKKVKAKIEETKPTKKDGKKKR